MFSNCHILSQLLLLIYVCVNVFKVMSFVADRMLIQGLLIKKILWPKKEKKYYETILKAVLLPISSLIGFVTVIIWQFIIKVAAQIHKCKQIVDCKIITKINTFKVRFIESHLDFFI